MPKVSKDEKLILVLATSTLVIDASKNALEVILDWVPYIYYPVQFHRNKKTIKALINFGNKVNIMALAYLAKLGLKVCLTNVGAQKIDGS